MMRVIYLSLMAVLLAASYGEAIKCYHCYETFNATSTLKRSVFGSFGDKFVPCDKNKANWNSWNCPVQWPICVVMTGKVKDHFEISRSCAEKNFCSKYVPPSGVRVDSCRECNTTLCNDVTQEFPDPPLNSSAPLFVFNININLRMVRSYLDSN